MSNELNDFIQEVDDKNKQVFFGVFETFNCAIMGLEYLAKELSAIFQVTDKSVRLKMPCDSNLRTVTFSKQEVKNFVL